MNALSPLSHSGICTIHTRTLGGLPWCEPPPLSLSGRNDKSIRGGAASTEPWLQACKSASGMEGGATSTSAVMPDASSSRPDARSRRAVVVAPADRRRDRGTPDFGRRRGCLPPVVAADVGRARLRSLRVDPSERAKVAVRGRLRRPAADGRRTPADWARIRRCQPALPCLALFRLE